GINTMTYYIAFCARVCSIVVAHLCAYYATPQPHILSYSAVQRKACSRAWLANIRHRIIRSFEPRSSCLRPRDWIMTKSDPRFHYPARLSVNGANASLRNAWRVWRTCRVPGVRPVFPPELVMQVKAVACELPKESGLPLSRYSGRDLVREVARRGIVAK